MPQRGHEPEQSWEHTRQGMWSCTNPHPVGLLHSCPIFNALSSCRCSFPAWCVTGPILGFKPNQRQVKPGTEHLQLDRGFNQPSVSQTVLSHCGEPNSLSVPAEGSPVAVLEGLNRAGLGSSCAQQCGDWAGPAVSSAIPPSQLEKGCVSCTGISTGGR